MMKREQPQQNIGGDVVGEIANHLRMRKIEMLTIGDGAYLWSEQRVQIDRKKVAFHNLYMGGFGVAHPELHGEHAVNLNRNELVGSRHQVVGQDASSWTDLQNNSRADVPQRLNDAGSC